MATVPGRVHEAAEYARVKRTPRCVSSSIAGVRPGIFGRSAASGGCGAASLRGVLRVVVEARDDVGPKRVDDDPEHVVRDARRRASEQRRVAPQNDCRAWVVELVALRTIGAGIGVVHAAVGRGDGAGVFSSGGLDRWRASPRSSGDASSLVVTSSRSTFCPANAERSQPASVQRRASRGARRCR